MLIKSFGIFNAVWQNRLEIMLILRIYSLSSQIPQRRNSIFFSFDTEVVNIVVLFSINIIVNHSKSFFLRPYKDMHEFRHVLCEFDLHFRIKFMHFMCTLWGWIFFGLHKMRCDHKIRKRLVKKEEAKLNAFWCMGGRYFVNKSFTKKNHHHRMHRIEAK